MTTSQASFLSEVIDGKSPIPEGTLAYFRERYRNKLYHFIVSRFLEKEKNKELTRSELARRINKSREQITRLLSSPGNWENDTVSDLVIAICCGEMDFSSVPFSEAHKRNTDQVSMLQSTLITASETSSVTSFVMHHAQSGVQFSTTTASARIRMKSEIVNA